MSPSESAPVLIVDDDELVSGIVRRRLERLGIRAITAASAEEALPKIESMPVSALVLDLSMPGRSGLDLAEFVRVFGSYLTGVSILIFTGTRPTEETRELARRVNAELYLKPDDLDALLQRVADIVDQLDLDPTGQRLRRHQLGFPEETTRREES
jgi:DNA-binding NtrC family response regulator